MTTRRILLGAALLLFGPIALCAEVFVTVDGSEIRGELVGFEDGCYLVRIGRFTKKIPEERVRDIRSEAAGAASDRMSPSSSSSSFSPPRSLSPTANPFASSRTPENSSHGNLDPAAFQRMLDAAGLGGRRGGGAPAAGGSLPVSRDTEDLLKQAVDMQRNDPAVGALGGGGDLQGKVQQLLKGDGDPRMLEGLRDNPSMGVMVERFRNKQFQQRLMDELRRMNENLNPGQENPNLEMLEGLFQQLNDGSGTP